MITNHPCRQRAAPTLRNELREEAIRLGYVSAAEFDRLVRPERMTRPGR